MFKNNISLFFIFVYIFLTGCEFEKQVEVIIISPSNTETLSSQNQVQILARIEPTIDISKRIFAKIEYLKDEKAVTISEGDIRSLSALDKIQAFWNITDFSEGEYQIRVSMEGAISDQVNVTINQPPKVDIGLGSIQNFKQGTQVQLFAIVDTTDKTPIEKFIWTLGDNDSTIVTKSPMITHNFVDGDTIKVWLEVQDDLGGVTLITRDLYLLKDEGQIKKEKDCGCNSITISAGGGNSGTYCIPTVELNGQRVIHPENLEFLKESGCAIIGDVGKGGCPANTIPINCVLGQKIPGNNQNRLNYNFEVKAELSKNTNDVTQCPEGQYARLTSRSNGEISRLPNPEVKIPPPSGIQTLPKGEGVSPFEFTAENSGKRYPPYEGPNYGSDNYSAPYVFKRHLPGTIRWLDAPGQNILKGENSVGRSQEFIAFVRGSTTCWCRFIVIQKWTRANGAAVGNKVEILGGYNCNAGLGVEDNRGN